MQLFSRTRTVFLFLLAACWLPLAAHASNTATLPHDLSAWGMFMAADIVVKGVMIGLLLASVITWTIWLVKTVELGVAKHRLKQVDQQLDQSVSLQQALPLLTNAGAPFSHFATQLEEEVSTEAVAHLPAAGIKERVAMAFSSIEAQTGRALNRGTGLLATIGSTAPFVGLFGTVWGIMNSFIGIAQAQTTNLSVVAPGIAEALLATALGLVAAIPAVMIYNFFARAMAEYRGQLADLVIRLQRILARDLDRARFTASPTPERQETL